MESEQGGGRACLARNCKQGVANNHQELLICMYMQTTVEETLGKAQTPSRKMWSSRNIPSPLYVCNIQCALLSSFATSSVFGLSGSCPLCLVRVFSRTLKLAQGLAVCLEEYQPAQQPSDSSCSSDTPASCLLFEVVRHCFSEPVEQLCPSRIAVSVVTAGRQDFLSRDELGGSGSAQK